jgi:hypothetical protein
LVVVLCHSISPPRNIDCPEGEFNILHILKKLKLNFQLKSHF